MTTLSEMVGNYSKPIETSGITEGSKAGMSAGIEIATRSQQLEATRMELGFKRQQIEQSKMEHITGLFDKAMATDDPTLRQMYLKQFQVIGGNFGYPISDDLVDTAQKSDKIRQDWLSSLPYRNLQDPMERSVAVRDAAGALIGGPLKVADYLNKLTEQQARAEEARLLGQNRNEVAQTHGDNADIGKLLPFATPRDAEILRRGRLENPEWFSAYGRAQAVYSAAMQRQNEAKTTNLESQATNRDAGTDIKKDTLKETTRHHLSSEQIARARVTQTADSLKLRGASLTLRQQQQLARLEDKVEANPIVKQAQMSMQYSDTALDRLKPGMKWIDMYDVAADYNRLITGQNRAAFAGEDRRTFSDFSALWGKWYGKVSGQEEGGPSNTEITLFRDRLEAMRDVWSRAHDNTYKKYWQSRVTTGAVDPEVAKSHFITNKLNENSTWDLKPGEPALTNKTKPVSRNPGPGSSTAEQTKERQRAITAIQQILTTGKPLNGWTEQMIRDNYKKKTGKDLDFVTGK